MFETIHYRAWMTTGTQESKSYIRLSAPATPIRILLLLTRMVLELIFGLVHLPGDHRQGVLVRYRLPAEAPVDNLRDHNPTPLIHLALGAVPAGLTRIRVRLAPYTPIAE